MAKPSKKGAKTEAEVAAEARRKKEILDKVAESNLPTKTVLKELGISRSTYYSWLKRYEEYGEEGLLDSRSLPTEEEEVEKAAPPAEPAEPTPTPKVEAEEIVVESRAESVDEEIKEEEPPFPPPEEIVAKPLEPPIPPEEEEPEKVEKVSIPKPAPTFGGREERKGFAGYAFIAVVLLVVGLLLSISLSNYNTYQLENSGQKLTLRKGKFAPRGVKQVDSFEPVAIGDMDVSGLTQRKFTGQDAVYKALFTFFMDQIDAEAGKGEQTDTAKINVLLDKAEKTLRNGAEGDLDLDEPRFQLAQKRVEIAEMGLKRAYGKALPVYEEALRTGLADRAELKAEIETMQKALGVVPAVALEAPAKESAVVPAEEELPAKKAEAAAPPAITAKEAETTIAPEEAPAQEAEVAAPSATTAKEAETTIAPEEAPAQEAEVAGSPAVETQKTETEVEVETSLKEAETTAGEKESGAVGAPIKPEEETKKPTSFMQWLRSKQSQ